MKYQIKTSSRFKRDLKRCAKRGLDMQLVYDAIPQGHRLESHAKSLINRRFLRFSVTSFQYRGTDGAARAMQARLDIAESRQKSTKSSLEGGMSFCFFFCARKSKK